jgi:hypothetical protein
LAWSGSPVGRAAADLTFVLGHEIQHGFNYAGTKAAYHQFDTDLARAARSDHDYTSAIGSVLAANRRDEARSNIAGWNALASRVTSESPDATLKDVFDASPRAYDVVERQPGQPPRYVARAEFTLNPDMSMSTNAESIEAMAKNYFDKGRSSALGNNGNSDYQNYYGAYAVSRACQYEAAHPARNGRTLMTLGMDHLGLQEDLLEQNGISLGEGAPPPRPYYDSSSVPPTLHYFDHTATTHIHIPIAAFDSEQTPRHSDPTTALEQKPEINRGVGQSNSEPDHRLYEEIRRGVVDLDTANGRTFDSTSERLSASLLVLAKQNGIDRVDHVVLSRQTHDQAAAHSIFLVKGELSDPASIRVAIPTAEAAQRPVQESMESLAILNRREIDNDMQEQALQQTQQQEHRRAARSL